jgi:hypothetical protein
MRPSLWRGVVTGGRLVGGNSACVATCAEQRRGIGGGEGADRQAPPVSDGGTVTGWQAGSCMEMGCGRRRAGLAAEEMANDDFFFNLNHFSN